MSMSQLRRPPLYEYFGSGLIRATRNDYELVLQGPDFLGAQSNLDQDLVVPGLELVQAEPRVHRKVFTRLAPKRFPDTPVDLFMAGVQENDLILGLTGKVEIFPCRKRDSDW